MAVPLRSELRDASDNRLSLVVGRVVLLDEISVPTYVHLIRVNRRKSLDKQHDLVRPGLWRQCCRDRSGDLARVIACDSRDGVRASVPENGNELGFYHQTLSCRQVNDVHGDIIEVLVHGSVRTGARRETVIITY